MQSWMVSCSHICMPFVKVEMSGLWIMWTTINQLLLLFALLLLSCKISTTTRTFYVGGIASGYFASQYFNGTRDEITSMINLGVEMVNNKQDGWWDYETRDVHLVMMINDTSQLDYPHDIAVKKTNELVEWQVAWAESLGDNLVGVIGAESSTESQPIANYGNFGILPQISYSSTATFLSNYAFFARNTKSDANTGPQIAQTIGEVLNIRYLTIVYQLGDLYSESVARSIQSAFIDIGPGHDVLKMIPIDMDYVNSEISDAVIDIQESGTPGIALAGLSDFMRIFVMSFNEEIDDPTKYVLICPYKPYGIDTMLPVGTVILQPTVPTSQLYQNFTDLWQSLDPSNYSSINGDERDELYSYSVNIVDAVFLLAIGLQNTGTSSNNITNESYRRNLYNNIISIDMEMISGRVEFQPDGDLAIVYGSIYNVNETNGNSNYIGNVDISNQNEVIYTTQDDRENWFTWPDGSKGYNQPSYSGQYMPYCQPGYEPALQTDGIYSCIPCAPLYYKPNYGSQSCISCPKGADCLSVGIVNPCLLPGYWRANCPQDSISDYNLYKIYECDYPHNCIGGCSLNSTCARDRLQSSALCGSCGDGYYQFSGVCSKCSMDEQSSLAVFSLFVIFSIILITGVALYTSTAIAVHKKSEGPRVLISMMICFNFLQIIPSSTRDIDWQPNDVFRSLLGFISFDPSNSITVLDILLKCSGILSYARISIYYVILFPLCLMSFIVIASSMMVYHAKKSNKFDYHTHISTVLYCLIGIGFISYIPCSFAAFSIFNCQDLGISGSWLRINYAVECSGDDYDALFALGVFGVIFISFGIPVLFVYVLYNRRIPIFEIPAGFITDGYKSSVFYWETVELTRKFLLSSLVLFFTRSSTKSLYLLIINNIFLLNLVNFRPYLDQIDNACARFFYVTECIVYLVALIDTSGIGAQDDYDMDSLYNLLFALVFIALFLVSPLCILLKVPRIRRAVWEYFGWNYDVFDTNGPSSITCTLEERKKHDAESEMAIEIPNASSNYHLSETNNPILSTSPNS